MKLEKRATNKFGLVIFIILIIALLAGGGYYLYKHKDTLNIDWNLSLPWDNDDNTRVEKDNSDTNKTTSKNDNGQIVFEGPTDSVNKEFNDVLACYTQISKTETTTKSFNIEITVKGAWLQNGNPIDSDCQLEVNRLLLDGYEIEIEPLKFSLTAGQTITKTIELPIADLENQELEGIEELQLYLVASNYRTTQNVVEHVEVTNTRSIDNNHYGYTIDELNGTKIQYYKTVTDATNTYIYFIIDNESSTSKADIKIRKLLINDKVNKQEDFDVVVNYGAKKIAYVTIPKAEVSNVKKFTVSFFNISTTPGEVLTDGTQEPDQITYLISDEYTKEF